MFPRKNPLYCIDLQQEKTNSHSNQRNYLDAIRECYELSTCSGAIWIWSYYLISFIISLCQSMSLSCLYYLLRKFQLYKACRRQSSWPVVLCWDLADSSWSEGLRFQAQLPSSLYFQDSFFFFFKVYFISSPGGELNTLKKLIYTHSNILKI